MANKETYRDYGLSGMRDYAESIKKMAMAVGLPPEAIAEEYNFKDIDGYNAVLAALGTNSSDIVVSLGGAPYLLGLEGEDHLYSG